MGTAVHGDRHIGLGQRRRVVGAVACHGHQPAFGLVLANQLELVFRRGFSQKVVNACLGRNGGGGELVVTGNHDGLDAHAAQFAKALLDAGLDDVLELNNAEHSFSVGHRQRRAAAARHLVGHAQHFSGQAAALGFNMLAHGINRAFAQLPGLAVSADHVHATHAGLGGEGHVMRFAGQCVSRTLALGQRNNAAPLGRLISGRCLTGRHGQRGLRNAGRGQEHGGLAIAMGDGAGLVEQQHIHVACGFYRAA